jgi:hypothetical protein
MGYNGNLNSRATEVITTQGDLRRGDSSGNPERLAVGSANQILQSNGSTESWVTLPTADSIITTEGDIIVGDSSGDPVRFGAGTAGKFLTTQGASSAPTYSNPTLSFIVSLTGETSDATVADDLAQIRLPFAFELTAVRAFCNTAPTGATLTFDIEEAGSSILSTLITIDATEKTSTTASTPPVISDSTLADDAIISFNCDQIGSTVAGAGIKIVLIGYQIV